MRVINIPRTQTVLALGILVGCFLAKDMDWNTAMLMILTYYFTKEQMKSSAP